MSNDRQRRGDAHYIVKFVSPSEQAVGVGILLSGQRIMTCAHVVNAALGREIRSQEMPNSEITVTLPLALAEPIVARARVTRWIPPHDTSSIASDIAGLEIVNAPASLSEIIPARLATDLEIPGRAVDVYGFPSKPHRALGAWARATLVGRIASGILQLDAAVDASLLIQPGYSGSPVIDRTTGSVLGILAAAPGASSGGRDSYAFGADQLRLSWPDSQIGMNVLSRKGVVRKNRDGVRTITAMHLADLRFGQLESNESSLERLHLDIEWIIEDQNVRPDLVLISGDLANSAQPSEYEEALRFLENLSETLAVPRRHFAIVPGVRDVNLLDSQAYFLTERARNRRPAPPFWPKWHLFSELFHSFYEGVEGATFMPSEPWSLFEMPELRLVVAGFNSTILHNHENIPLLGTIGSEQARWFADRLQAYRDRGWLRLGIVHHNAVANGDLDKSGIQDAENLDQTLARGELANLLFVGQSTQSEFYQLRFGLPVVSTGRVSEAESPNDILRQYQLVTIAPEGLDRYNRAFYGREGRWIGDLRVDPHGSNWRVKHSHQFSKTQAALQGDLNQTARPSGAMNKAPLAETDRAAQVVNDFFNRVVEAAAVTWPSAELALRPENSYFQISIRTDHGVWERWPVGVADGNLTVDVVESYIHNVHRDYIAADPGTRSELVFSGETPTQDVVDLAKANALRLRNFTEFSGILDLRPLVARQTAWLARDRVYPDTLYVDQRFRLVGPGSESDVRSSLLEQVISWVLGDDAKLVMVLGEFGRGKSFLLRQIARVLQRDAQQVLPILVELRALEKGPSLDQLLAQHLYRYDVEGVTSNRLRYLVDSGRLVLLFDGFDELQLRVGYDSAAEYLRTLAASISNRAKIVLTSRTLHFRSERQVFTALGKSINSLGMSRVVIVEDFSDDQVQAFLRNIYRNEDQAARRFHLLSEVRDLLGLSRNPRMLSFIADLPATRLEDIRQRHGSVSAAKLYDELLDYWLIGEEKRQQHRGGPKAFSKGSRLAVCTDLARRLWVSREPYIREGELEASVKTVLTELTRMRFTPREAIHAIGSGSLLVRNDDGGFRFVHQSVMEWLIARDVAESLKNSGTAAALDLRTMSPLMADFFVDLIGVGAATTWAERVLTSATFSDHARQNALGIQRALGKERSDDETRSVSLKKDLSRLDLRDRELDTLSLHGSNLQGADLSGMNLTGIDLGGADLRGADLRGATLLGGSIEGASFAGSLWDSAAIIGSLGASEHWNAQELEPAAVTGRDKIDVMIAAGRSAARDFVFGVRLLAESGVRCVALSHDGSLLAIGAGWSAEIVDVPSRKVVRVINGHAGQIAAVAFSPDSKRLATGAVDGTARIWEVNSGKQTMILREHNGSVSDVAFSNSGSLVATGCEDGIIRVWDYLTCQSVATSEVYESPVLGIAMSPNEACIAAAHSDGRGRIWNWQTGEIRQLIGHTDWVGAVQFSCSGRWLATGSGDTSAGLWDAKTGQLIRSFAGHTRGVADVAFSPDDSQIVTASWDRTVRVWDVASGDCSRIISGHTSTINQVVFDPNGDRIATASGDGTARLWRIDNGDSVGSFESHSSPMTGIRFTPDGSKLVSVSDDGNARVWSTSRGALLATLTGHTHWITGMAISSDGRLLATASHDRTARVWSLADGRSLCTLEGHTDWVRGVSFSPDGRHLVTAAGDGTARLWEIPNGRQTLVLTGHTGQLLGVNFSPDGQRIATAAGDGTARIWDVASGQLISTLPGHGGQVWDVVFSADGSLLATACADGMVRIWSKSGSLLSVLVGHKGSVNGIAFAKSGKIIASAAGDGTVRLWDVATGTTITRLVGHGNTVWDVSFSQSAKLAATCSHDGTARIWRTKDGKHLATLLPLGGGFATFFSDGRYKLRGDSHDSVWWAMKLRRFEAGELDPYVDSITRLDDDAEVDDLISTD